MGKRKTLASTTSDNSPDHGMSLRVDAAPIVHDQTFYDQRARERFFQFFLNRRLVMERPVDLEHLQNLGLQPIFSDKGWTALFSPPIVASGRLVREFYANSKVECGSVRTWVRGTNITLTAQVIRDILGFSACSHDMGQFPLEVGFNEIASSLVGRRRVWDGRSPLKQGELTERFKILHHIVCSNLLPCSHHSTVSTERAKFMFFLAKNVGFDPAEFIFSQIWHIAQPSHLNSAIGWVGLVYKVLARSGVILTLEEPIQVASVIGKESTIRSRSQRRLEPSLDADNLLDPSAEPVNEAIDEIHIHSSYKASAMTALVEKLTAIEQMVFLLQARVHILEASMDRMTTRVAESSTDVSQSNEQTLRDVEDRLRQSEEGQRMRLVNSANMFMSAIAELLRNFMDSQGESVPPATVDRA